MLDSGCAENLSVEFSEKIYRENEVFGMIFFQIGISLFNALVVNVWIFAALRRQMPNNG